MKSIFLQLSGPDLNGESADKDHGQRIELTGFHHEVRQPSSPVASTAGGHTVGRAEHGDLALVKDLDVASQTSWREDLRSDRNNRKSDWFALYANDRVIDDERYCAGLLRGQFRMHAKSGRGISKGCITLELESDFALLRRLLEATDMEQVPGTKWMSYGTVVVS